MHEVKKERYSSNDCSYIRSLFWVITWKLLFIGTGWTFGGGGMNKFSPTVEFSPSQCLRVGQILGGLFLCFSGWNRLNLLWIEIILKICDVTTSCRNILDKLTKLNKICFSRECFAADFSQFFKCPSFSFTWLAGYLPSIQSISGLFLKYPDFLRSLKSLGNSWGNL